MLQQLPVLLQGDSQAADLCSDCAVLQLNLPQAEGAGNLEGQGQHVKGGKGLLDPWLVHEPGVWFATPVASHHRSGACISPIIQEGL